MSFCFYIEPINSKELKKQIHNKSSGALVIFEGIVRNYNNGFTVEGLYYEAYENLAIIEANKIIEEAKTKFDISEIKIAHRTGDLKIGECAVWIGVSAGHRDSAFEACRYLIDQIKERLPIWKKETYTNGQNAWVEMKV